MSFRLKRFQFPVATQYRFDCIAGRTATSHRGEVSVLILKRVNHPVVIISAYLGFLLAEWRLPTWLVPQRRHWELSEARLSCVLKAVTVVGALWRAPEQIDPAALPKAMGAYTDAGVFETMRTNGGAVALYSEDFGDKGYLGKVAVLINERTASAAEGFAWHMKLKTKATLIGRATAGALLGAEYYTLPGGWRLSVLTYAGWGPDGKSMIDKPVSPQCRSLAHHFSVRQARTNSMDARW